MKIRIDIPEEVTNFFNKQIVENEVEMSLYQRKVYLEKLRG